MPLSVTKTFSFLRWFSRSLTLQSVNFYGRLLAKMAKAFIFLLVIFLPACQSLQTSSSPIHYATQEDVLSAKTSLSQQLNLQQNHSQELAATQQELSRDLARQQQQFNKLHLALSQLKEELMASGSFFSGPATSSKPKQIVTESNKLVLGQQELIGITDYQLILPARVDTGAKITSLHAKNIQHFERDGQPWVRFSIEHQATLVDEEQQTETYLEAPLVRKARIKQASGQEERPVVSLEILLGSLAQTVELTLTDRTNLEFPLLLGRNFFMDIALVDVSKNNVQGKPSFPKAANPPSEALDTNNLQPEHSNANQ